MSLADRTIEDIALSLHKPLEGYGKAQVSADADSDSSIFPFAWTSIAFTTDEHDSTTFRLTYDEAEQLHDRLGRILGKVPA